MTAVLSQPRLGDTPDVERRRRGWRYRLDTKASPYLYIAPFFVLFAVFGLFPLLYTGYVSLLGWRTDTAGSENRFVGLANYAHLLHVQFFWNALRNPVAIGILSTVPPLLMPLGLAP